MSAETWFAVREGDIFPEEFRNFVMLPGELGAAFLAQHGALFDPEFWLVHAGAPAGGRSGRFLPLSGNQAPSDSVSLSGPWTLDPGLHDPRLSTPNSRLPTHDPVPRPPRRLPAATGCPRGAPAAGQAGRTRAFAHCVAAGVARHQGDHDRRRHAPPACGGARHRRQAGRWRYLQVHARRRPLRGQGRQHRSHRVRLHRRARRLGDRVRAGHQAGGRAGGRPHGAGPGGPHRRGARRWPHGRGPAPPHDRYQLLGGQRPAQRQVHLAQLGPGRGQGGRRRRRHGRGPRQGGDLRPHRHGRPEGHRSGHCQHARLARAHARALRREDGGRDPVQGHGARPQRRGHRGADADLELLAR